MRTVGIVALISVLLFACEDEGPTPTTTEPPTPIWVEITVTPMPTLTPTNTPTPMAIPTPSSTPTPTNTPIPTTTPTPLPTLTPTNTPTPTAIPTPSSTPTPTNTPIPTATPTPSSTPTPTNTPIPTATPAPSPTLAPTNTPIPTATLTSTPEPKPSAVNTGDPGWIFRTQGPNPVSERIDTYVGLVEEDETDRETALFVRCSSTPGEESWLQVIIFTVIESQFQQVHTIAQHRFDTNEPVSSTWYYASYAIGDYKTGLFYEPQAVYSEDDVREFIERLKIAERFAVSFIVGDNDAVTILWEDVSGFEEAYRPVAEACGEVVIVETPMPTVDPAPEVTPPMTPLPISNRTPTPTSDETLYSQKARIKYVSA